MSENHNTNQYKIFEICESIYKNEKFLENHPKEQEFLAYLIEKNIIDKIKKDSDYDTLRPLLAEDKEYTEIKEKITIKNIKIKIEEANPKKFNSSNELLEELNKTSDKSFAIIKQECLNKIFKINASNKLQGKITHFKFAQDNIKIIFNGNDQLQFSNNKGIIGNKFLFQPGISITPIDNNQQKNETLNEVPINNIKFKEDLEILIRIFYYNKYLREKENNTFKNLENGETVYLINNSWMEEYKSVFVYQYLENYLKDKKGYSFVDTQYNLSPNTIKNLIEALPNEYIIYLIK